MTNGGLVLLEDQQLDWEVHLLVNAPAWRSPQKCLAGVEVRTTGADWPICGKLKCWGFFLSANKCYL